MVTLQNGVWAYTWTMLSYHPKSRHYYRQAAATDCSEAACFSMAIFCSYSWRRAGIAWGLDEGGWPLEQRAVDIALIHHKVQQRQISVQHNCQGSLISFASWSLLTASIFTFINCLWPSLSSEQLHCREGTSRFGFLAIYATNPARCKPKIEPDPSAGLDWEYCWDYHIETRQFMDTLGLKHTKTHWFLQKLLVNTPCRNML